jgi:hypothetical protein
MPFPYFNSEAYLIKSKPSTSVALIFLQAEILTLSPNVLLIITLISSFVGGSMLSQ